MILRGTYRALAFEGLKLLEQYKSYPGFDSVLPMFFSSHRGQINIDLITKRTRGLVEFF